jgi:hypothetical protein
MGAGYISLILPGPQLLHSDGRRQMLALSARAASVVPLSIQLSSTFLLSQMII